MKIKIINWFTLALSMFAITGCDDDSSSENTSLLLEEITAETYLLEETIVAPKYTDASISVRIYGQNAEKGEYVVPIPSLGRGIEDFTELYGSDLTTELVQSGYRVVLIQPRGIGDSIGDLNPSNVSMSLLVDDIKQTLDGLNIAEAHFIGHAFGNRLSRAFATLYPENVSSVTLLAAGGQVPLTDDQENTLRGIFATDGDDRLALVDLGFFAEGNDPIIWLEGWFVETAEAQGYAAQTTDINFIEAGGKPILLVQPVEDFIAPPEDAGRLLIDTLGDQITYVEVIKAGHALLPEQPKLVASIVISYLDSID